MKYINYNTKLYPFRDRVEEYLRNGDLENIHNVYRFDSILTDVEGGNSDQGQSLHRMFYDGMDLDPNFKSLYDDFVKTTIRPQFDSSILFQKFPTFRIHQPNNICVFDWHRDSDFNHSENEVNIFLPITRAHDTNTIWAESEQYKEDFAPLEADYGEIIIWNGAILKHGNKINDTPQSRVSFDFRVIRLSDYDESLSKKSLATKKKFVRGEYFDERMY